MRTVLGKFFCTATTLASGIPLGREGPSVQVGAGIASVLGRALGLPPERVKALIPVGAAAAIAAAFNTPMAAVLFALEDIVETLHVPHVHMDHALHLALERMSKYHLDVLPVIHRADTHKLEGVVMLRDVLDAYGVTTNSRDAGLSIA